jgi:transcriptional regulator with XRE-family HTH domain
MKNTYAPPEDDGNEINVGRQMRLLRRERGLSLRSLADLSGLNFNTLSLIETGKTSPSVSTLQQVANALGIAITAFFDSQPVKKSIIHQKSGARPHVAYSQLILEDMAAGLNLRKAQPFLVTMEVGASSGPDAIVHTGHEFVYLIEGSITYTIDGGEYLLEPGDSLVFEAPLPHQWENTGEMPSRSLLILCPADENDQPTERHFMNKGELELI